MFTRWKMADVSVLSLYGSCETRNKQCGSCILTTKRVTRTNYYDKKQIKKIISILFVKFWYTRYWCKFHSHWRSPLPWRPRASRWRRRRGWRRGCGRRSSRIPEFLSNHFLNFWTEDLYDIFRNPIWPRILTDLDNLIWVEKLSLLRTRR